MPARQFADAAPFKSDAMHAFGREAGHDNILSRFRVAGALSSDHN